MQIALHVMYWLFKFWNNQGCDRRHYSLFYISLQNWHYLHYFSFLDIIHYFFKSTKIMSLFLYKFQKLWLFSQLFLWNPIFLKERLAHKALGLLPTAQSVFERDMGSQGSFTLCFSILQQCLTLFCREMQKCDTFCRKTLKYDTFCCENFDPALIPLRHYFWLKKDIIRQKNWQ